MNRPEWTTIERGLRSCRIARCSLAVVLVGLGILGGIGLGMPIGREQQARVDAQPVSFEEPQDWRPAGDRSDSMAPRLLPPARRNSAQLRGSVEL